MDVYLKILIPNRTLPKKNNKCYNNYIVFLSGVKFEKAFYKEFWTN